MSSRGIIFIVVFSLLLVLTSLILIKNLDPGIKDKNANISLVDMSQKNIYISTDFKLANHDNHDFTFKDLHNRYSLIYFGFTLCPDICPLTIQKMVSTYNLLNQQIKSQVNFIFISIDPKRDNSNSLKQFVSEYDNKIIGLTGIKSELDKITNSLNVYYASQKESKKDYFIDHSSFIYFLDPKGKLLFQFLSNVTTKELAETIEIVIN